MWRATIKHEGTARTLGNFIAEETQAALRLRCRSTESFRGVWRFCFQFPRPSRGRAGRRHHSATQAWIIRGPPGPNTGAGARYGSSGPVVTGKLTARSGRKPMCRDARLLGQPGAVIRPLVASVLLVERQADICPKRWPRPSRHVANEARRTSRGRPSRPDGLLLPSRACGPPESRQEVSAPGAVSWTTTGRRLVRIAVAAGLDQRPGDGVLPVSSHSRLPVTRMR